MQRLPFALLLALLGGCGEERNPCLDATIRHISAPSAKREASVYEGGCGPYLAPQVVVEFDTPRGKGGGGVFAVDDSVTRLDVRWLDDATLEIAYPPDARVGKRETSTRFLDEQVRVVYRIAAPLRPDPVPARGAT